VSGWRIGHLAGRNALSCSLSTTRVCTRVCTLACAMSLLAGCASDGAGGRLQPGGADTVRAENCKSGDERIADSNACLMDDAACYQLANGGWCTGPRGNTCPTGSSALAAGQPCPPGAVCFRMSESLECLAG